MRAGEGGNAVCQRLPHDFQHVSLELWQLIEEELPDEQRFVQALGAELMGRGENPQGDGEIEAGPCLLDGERISLRDIGIRQSANPLHVDTRSGAMTLNRRMGRSLSL